MKSILVRGKVAFLGVLLFISCLMPIVYSDDEPTSVSIEPVRSVVGTSESFTIGVYCNPMIPIKSFECCISFDPSLLSVTDVREGTIFDGFETFFNDGSIDNTNGEINLIYGLIMGTGNVIDPGYLVWIDFQSEQNTGQSAIMLSNVGITNETMYIPITISNGFVDIQDAIPLPEKFYANQDINIQNGGITGSYVNTQNSDDIYMQIGERDSGGKPSKRYSYLEHKWTIQVTEGLQYYEFYVEAYHTTNSEDDDFVFAYSSDDVSYIDMVTVTKTTDDNIYQIYVLPTTISGNIYIRIQDTDKTQGNRYLDSIIIDHMYIEGTGTPPPNRAPTKPTDPNPFDTETGVDINPTLSVHVHDPDGDIIDVTFYNETGAVLGTVFNVESGTRASIDLTNFLFETTYIWYAVAEDSEYTNTSDTWSFTTRADIPVGGIYVWDIDFTSSGPHLKSTVTIRIDSNNNGVEEESDELVTGATVNYKLTHQDSGNFNTYSSETDETGTVIFQWKKAPTGPYEGLVTDIIHYIYDYESMLDVDNPDYYTH